MEEPWKEFEKMDNVERLEEVKIEGEKPLWRRVIWRIVAGTVALLVIAGLVYLSGLRQFFFYKKTSQNIKVEKKESILRAETIELPLDARILRAKGSADSSTRDQDNIERLVKQSNKVWNQADINLKLRKVEKIKMNQQELENFSASPQSFSRGLEGFDSNVINVFFIGNLEGPSGLAYTNSENILIADYTTSHDFLVFAHEIGHVLGLKHQGADGTLMATGASEAELTRSQAEEARHQSEQFFNK